jgi:hypothetical protein
LKTKLKLWFRQIKELHGSPHYVALVLATGVFVAITPTIPFHTVIAVGMSFPLKCSKAAAAIGVWACNPVTLPVFYLGSYKAGNFLFGTNLTGGAAAGSMTELIKLGLDVTVATIVGGTLIALPPGVATYFIARKVLTTLQARKAASSPNPLVYPDTG